MIRSPLSPSWPDWRITSSNTSLNMSISSSRPVAGVGYLTSWLDGWSCFNSRNFSAFSVAYWFLGDSSGCSGDIERLWRTSAYADICLYFIGTFMIKMTQEWMQARIMITYRWNMSQAFQWTKRTLLQNGESVWLSPISSITYSSGSSVLCDCKTKNINYRWYWLIASWIIAYIG